MMYNEKEETTLMDLLVGQDKKVEESDFLGDAAKVDEENVGQPD